MTVTFATQLDEAREVPDLDAPDADWDAYWGPSVNVSNAAAVELLELLGYAPWNDDPRPEPPERQRLLDDLAGQATAEQFRVRVRMALVHQRDPYLHDRLTELHEVADAAAQAGRPVTWA